MKKHFRYLSTLLAALIIFSVSSSALSELEITPKERFLSFIYAEDGVFESSAEALSALKCILGTETEIIDTFEKAFVGFAANLTENQLALVNSSNLFDAHISGSFAALEYTENSITFEEQIYTATDMLSLPNHSENSTYTGRGIVVAVIDNGFDISHSALNGKVESPKITPETYTNTSVSNELNAKSDKNFYVSEKLPFVYNYVTRKTDVFTINNHGTHVAAAIGGRDEVMTGVAPDCQLLLMKVFDESLSTASELYVMQALEDAIVLDADIVNMSIGTYSGFSEDGLTLMGRAARNLEKAGVSVVCAAGNDATIGSNSYFKRIYGVDMPLSANSDYGTLSYPATMSDFIAVASANNLKIAYDTLIHTANGNLTRISYTDTNASLGIIKASFFAHFSGKTVKYELVPGFGRPEDFTGLDLKDKIALIERGELTFAEKVKNATAAGAVGVIVYNNVDEEEMTYMELGGCKIPGVFISKSDGEFLKNSGVHELVFDTKLSDFTNNPNAYRMSSFSSWGVTPDLKLKPDITSVGERIYSAASGGNYSSLSGTSMATPLISGALALFAEKLNSENSKYISNKRPDYLKTALMNSAAPLINPDTGAEYSPRVQGAGLANFSAAADLQLLFTDDAGNPSACLGNNLGQKFEIKTKITNTSDTDINLKVSASILADTALDINFGPVVGTKKFNSLVSLPLKGATVTLNSKTVNINRYAKGRGEETVSLKAGQTLDLSVIIDLGEHKAKLDSDFDNGFFADGFIYLDADGFTCSLPFTGFVGDFYKAPALDATFFESPFLFGNLLSSRSDDRDYMLGSNDLTVNGKISVENVAFSPNNDGYFDALFLAPSLLRNVTDLTVKIIDDTTGKTVCTDSLSSKMTKSEVSPTRFIKIWSGGDYINPDFVFPDGRYTAVIGAKLNGKVLNGEIKLPFAIDTTLPTLKNSRIIRENGKTTLEIEVEDNIGVREVSIYTTDVILMSDIDDGDKIFTFDITEISGKLIWADITDYAMNTKTVKAATLEEVGK